MERIQQVLSSANQLAGSEEFEQFLMNAQDFVSQRGASGQTASTQISQAIVNLEDAAQILNRSFSKGSRSDGSGDAVNIINPVVMPKSHRSWFWIFVALGAIVAGVIFGAGLATFVPGLSFVLFGPHYWLLVIGFILFNLWKNSYVMIPDGCQALITKFGKVEEMVPAGRQYIFHPWKRVSYIVNTTKEYPYNAPIREAPTMGQVNASVDLFLQFRINDPREFIFRLGGVNGFSEKLQNAISEQTRALIYSQRAEEIYDLVGESTKQLLDSLNEQFMPAVEFVNANITHAEPSDQEYRMDLAASELVRVAKEAYTYNYELDLRKKRDEGDLEKELAGLRETLSGIRADIATFEAQIKTAHEKEINRANAYANQLMIEAESEADANAALFQAQALDIRALQSAYYPEILEYRYQQAVLDQIDSAADHLPQIINIGADEQQHVDYMTLARQMLGIEEKPLYTAEELATIRARLSEMTDRIRSREKTIREVTNISTDDITPVEEVIS